jgi:hypothetical protein
VIISVGYRVKSKQGTKFRQWATSVLRNYALRGYAVNQRFEQTDTLYTNEISTTLQLDLTRHNAQYPEIFIEEKPNIHDRFIVIDNELYHIGASLKDLGKKLFAFSKMEMKANELLKNIQYNQQITI